jgi:hypothetical protein
LEQKHLSSSIQQKEIHAINACWYVRSAKNITGTTVFSFQKQRLSNIASAKFFPVHCKMPAIEPGDTVQLAAQDPITAMQKLSNAPIDLNPKHMDALRKLTEIFNEAACVDDENTENNPAPRVKQPLTRVQPASSHDPTSPKVLTVMMVIQVSYEHSCHQATFVPFYAVSGTHKHPQMVLVSEKAC